MNYQRKSYNSSVPLKVMHIVGAHPNFMKVAPLMEEMSKYPQDFDQLLLHTGQHYDERMSKSFFDDLRLTKPDVYLGVGSGTHAEQTGKIMIEFERPITVKEGTNTVVGNNPDNIINTALNILKNGISRKKIPKYWDGKAAERIIRILSIKL